MKEITCMLEISVILFLAGQTAFCQRPDVTADVHVWGCAVFTANMLQSRFLLLPSMFSPYRLIRFINHILTNKDGDWQGSSFFFPLKLFSGARAKAKLGKGKLCVSQQKAVSRCPGLKLTLMEPATMKIYLSSQVKRKCQKKIWRLWTVIENNWRFNMDKCGQKRRVAVFSPYTTKPYPRVLHIYFINYFRSLGNG